MRHKNSSLVARSSSPHLSADNVEQFVGDGLLAHLVVLEVELLQEGIAVVGSRLHGEGAGGMFGSRGVEQDGIEAHGQGLWQQGGEQLGSRWLEDEGRPSPQKTLPLPLRKGGE